MRFVLRSLILVLLVLLAGLSVSSSRGGDNDGFVPLFPNKSLAGWRVLRIWEHEVKKDFGAAFWRVLRFIEEKTGIVPDWGLESFE